MFYVGMHEGNITDGYISSSRWFNGEHQYRPNDFKRKIIKTFNDRKSARKEEARFLRMIKESEFGKKYYNLKNGRPAGTEPWNKGKKNIYSQETIQKMSAAKVGKPSPTKGKHMLKSSQNGKKSSLKLSKTVTGRKMSTRPDGTRFWSYPSEDCLVNKEQSSNPHSS
jgi:hypothetical protein